jgi:membrane associated rhomboid family serine protease
MGPLFAELSKEAYGWFAWAAAIVGLIIGLAKAILGGDK